MRTLSCMRGAVAAAILAIPVLVHADFKMGSPLAMLPADTQVAIAIDLTATGNAKSLLSLIPRDQVTQKLVDAEAKDAEKKKAGSGAASSEAFKGLISKSNTAVIGIQSIDVTGAAEPTVYGVLSGDFTKVDADSAVATLTGSKADDKGVSTLTDEKGKATYMFSPKDNLLLFSSKQDWLSSASGNVDAKTGLAAATSSFNTLVPALGSRNPDIAIYVDGKMVSEMMQKNPGAAMMAAPLASTKAVGIFLFPGDASPSLEIQLPYADEGGAKMAQAWLTQLVGMGKGQAQQALAGMAQSGAPASPDMAAAKAKVDKSIEMLNKIEITQTGSIATAKIPIPMDLIPKDTFTKNLMEGIDQSIAAKDASGAPNMAPPPAMGSDAPAASSTDAPAATEAPAATTDAPDAPAKM